MSQMRRAIDLIHFVIREGMSPDQVILVMIMRTSYLSIFFTPAQFQDFEKLPEKSA